MVLADAYPTDKERQRFRSEAEAMASLQHPNIVQLFEVGETRGQPFLAMEYVAGGNLHQKIGDRPQLPHCAAELVHALANAVQAAHRRGVVHRDLKPANVLLGHVDAPEADSERLYGVPKLTDFGLARRQGMQVSLSDSVSGTPGYMAPEQVPPEIAPGQRGEAGPATDIYGLGAILYQMLTGRPPFTGPDWMTILVQAVNTDPLPPTQLNPAVPADLETICLKCLHKEPQRRYASAGELADDLKRWLEGKTIHARPAGWAERTWKWARRHPVLSGALALALLTTVCAVAGLSLALWAEWAREEADRRTVDALRERERQANLSHQREQQLRARAEQNLYISRVSQAHLLWRDSNVAAALQALEACPETQRRWEWHYLAGLCDSSLVKRSAPLGKKSAPTGYQALAVTARTDGLAVAWAAPPAAGQQPAPAFVQVWDAQGRKADPLPVPLRQPVRRMALHAGKRLVCAVGTAGGVKAVCWRRGGKAPLYHIYGGPVWEMDSDGRWLAAHSAGQLHVYRLDTGTEAFRLRCPTPEAFAFGSGRLAVAVGAEVCVLRLPGGEVSRWPMRASRLAWQPGGELLAAFQPGRHLLSLHDLSGGVVKQLPLEGGEEGRSELLFSADGQYLVLLRGNGLHFSGLRSRTRYTAAVQGAVSMASSPDGQLVAAGCSDGAVRVFPLGRGGQPAVYRGHAGPVASLSFTPDGRALASGGLDGTVRLWDLTRPQEALLVPGPARGGALFFQADSEALWQAGNGMLVCRGPASGALLAAQTSKGTSGQKKQGLMAASADGTCLVLAASGREALRLYRLEGKAWKKGPALEGHERPITAVAVAPDGSLVVSGSAGFGRDGQAEGEVFVWDGNTGELLRRVSGPKFCVTGLAIDPEVKWAAVLTGWPAWPRGDQAPPPSGIVLWGLRTGDLARPLASNARGANIPRGAVFHPSGKQLCVIGGGRKALEVWDIEQRTKLWEASSAQQIADVAYHPDGTRLAVVLADGSVALRAVESGDQVLRLPAATSPPEDATFHPRVAFSPDGRYLAVSDWSGGVLLRDAGGAGRSAARKAARQRALGWHLSEAVRLSQRPFALWHHLRWAASGL
jgi:WD40 repeat protein